MGKHRIAKVLGWIAILSLAYGLLGCTLLFLTLVVSAIPGPPPLLEGAGILAVYAACVGLTTMIVIRSSDLAAIKTASVLLGLVAFSVFTLLMFMAVFASA